MEVTLGGNRVGSGKKMKAHLHNYERSTHNLSEEFITSAGAGILYPCLCKVAMRGDSFDIELDADVRTIPTVGPLFGRFKMQVDIYQCPVRLYQAILHNNPLAIGLNMAQVKFPMLTISTTARQNRWQDGKFSDSALLKYLGMSGLGISHVGGDTASTISRKINAIPALAYYDIFKTYYANKQEDKAYIIMPESKNINSISKNLVKVDNWGEDRSYEFDSNYNFERNVVFKWQVTNLKELIESNTDTDLVEITINSDPETVKTIMTSDLKSNNGTYQEIYNKSTFTIQADYEKNTLTFASDKNAIDPSYDVMIISINTSFTAYTKGINLKQFDLENIDNMRYDILTAHTLGVAFNIYSSSTYDYLPYSALIGKDSANKTYNAYPMNGLVLKTYQNDIFNNWLNTDWIEGENGISELSKVAIVDGAFSMDSLNFATKLYNMLNRIAVAGATYEDWQDVVYEEVQRRQIESPIFCGGMSKIIAFDEIVQTAPTEIAGEEQALGTLGGRGRALHETQKGGKLHIKCDEAAFIIGIVSLTPLISYTQGNEFYMTDLESMDDLHKPPMDGIGFQDLIGERMAWFDTVINATTQTIQSRSKIGKLPAWIEYMTSVNKAYGDMAATGGFGYMVLNRNYEQDESTHRIKDATTYVDPQKYNYVFAYDGLDAQNFWIKINWDIKARRKMSARLIPNV